LTNEEPQKTGRKAVTSNKHEPQQQSFCQYDADQLDVSFSFELSVNVAVEAVA
jgi:hypothetical protein